MAFSLGKLSVTACSLIGILAAGASPTPSRREYAAVVQSLPTGAYREACVVFTDDRATVRFSTGERIILRLETPGMEDEEILARDDRNRHWAIYVDATDAPPSPVRTAKQPPSFRQPSS